VPTDRRETNDYPEARKGTPRHFHLLWDEDLTELREVLQAILSRREEVVRHWYQLYVLHFGDARALSEAEFAQIFGTAIEHSKLALLEGSIERYTSAVVRLGEQLVERGVPIEEVIASLHLFEQSAQEVFPRDPPPPAQIYATFDKLCHVRIILLVSAYFRSHSAVSMERLAALEREAAQIPPASRSRFRGLVGASAVMRELYDRIAAAAATRGNLLIVGESGAGKELVARAVHESGPHSNRPFVAFNCAAIPRDLIESELFGYKRGAFSGANSEYLGLFRAADGGTLFLDEVMEMIPETQAKLLRVIQERTVRPVGSTREQPVDVRLIASTNRVPREALAKGQLREDLYYRLQATVLTVPPLRERTEDIPLLVDHFMAIFNERLGRNVTGIDDAAMRAMLDYSWPGNVRELANVIEAALTFSKNQIIGFTDLPANIRGHRPRRTAAQPRGSLAERPLPSFAETESDLIRRALESTGGNKLQAASLLGISRKKLYAKIKQHGL
jgi:two-component system, NtrC family, response regulator AtoC